MTPPIQNGSSWSNGSGYIDPTYRAAFKKERKDYESYCNNDAVKEFKQMLDMMTPSEWNEVARSIKKQMHGEEERHETINTLKAKYKAVSARITQHHQQRAIEKAVLEERERCMKEIEHWRRLYEEEKAKNVQNHQGGI